MFFFAFGAVPVSDFSIRVIADIDIDVGPVPLLIADFIA